MTRPIHEIVREIRRTWAKPYFGAVPYLDALSSVSSGKDMYGVERADHLVRYLLSNMTTFRGEDARRLKAELKSHL